MINKNKDNSPVSSDAMLFKKYKTIEYVIFGIILFLGLVASLLLGFERINPVGDINLMLRIFIGITAGLLVITLIGLIIIFYKIKHLKENNNDK